jgi:hypothetical protein
MSSRSTRHPDDAALRTNGLAEVHGSQVRAADVFTLTAGPAA